MAGGRSADRYRWSGCRKGSGSHARYWPAARPDHPGPFTFTRPLYIGRGIPNTWISSGQTISVSNITSGYNVTTGTRTTYGVSLAMTKPGTGRVITVSLTGTPPTGTVAIQLPIFNSVAVTAVTGGTYNSSTQTVTAATGASTITITLAS